MDTLLTQFEELQSDPARVLSPEQVKDQDGSLLGIKLQMTQAAMCHEYARAEFDNTLCVIKRGQLQDEMELYHRSYREARNSLALRDPGLADSLERDILHQKQLVFGNFQA